MHLGSAMGLPRRDSPTEDRSLTTHTAGSWKWRPGDPRPRLTSPGACYVARRCVVVATQMDKYIAAHDGGARR